MPSESERATNTLPHLVPPPRHVPLTVRLNNYFNTTTQVGVTFILVGGLMCYVMRRSLPAVLVAAIVTLFGIPQIRSGMREGRRRVRLLRRGLLANGFYLGRARASRTVAVEGMPGWEVGFKFTARDALEYEGSCYTYDPSPFDDDPYHLLLYDPTNPIRVLPLRAAPTSAGIFRGGTAARIGPHGQWRGDILAIVGHVVLIVWLCLFIAFFIFIAKEAVELER